ncbi:NAD-dependent epimerase/dehydratase family protein [soil metagenome]
MRVFLTGGTGYIGSAVLEAFVRAGHRVDALVRNGEKVKEVQARGAHPVVGELAEARSYADALAGAEVMVHTAFESSARGPQLDAGVLDAMLSVPAPSGRVLIYTSGVWVLGSSGVPMDETAPINPADLVAWRPGHEQRVLDAAASGLRTVIVRPGIVFGGFRGIVGDLFKDAANGLVRVIGPGDNHWPLIYDRDLADLYLRLAGTPDASGVFHANDQQDERVNDIVAAIARQVPVDPSIRHVPIAEARKKMGPFADALALDQVVRSPRARALGWSPSLHSVAANTAGLYEEWRRGRLKAEKLNAER